MKISLVRFPLVGGVLLVGWFATAPAHANIVGYVNKGLPLGYSLVANPLGANDNTITNLFSLTTAPSTDNFLVQKWTGSGYQNFHYWGAGVWLDQNNNPVGSVTLAVGEGAVVFNYGPITTNTFVGQVEGFVDGIGRLPVATSSPGIYLRGSIAPLAPSGFQDIMGRAPLNGDAVLKLDTAGNPLLSYFSGGLWHDPSGGNIAPTVQIAESAFFDTTGNQFTGFTLPSGNIVVVPEPTVAGMLGIGILLVVRRARSQN